MKKRALKLQMTEIALELSKYPTVEKELVKLAQEKGLEDYFGFPP